MKPTLKDIDKKISKATKILDDIASMVRDADLGTEKNIRRIGTALTYIFEVQHETWRADPSLVPNCLKGKLDKETGKTWGAPTSGSSGRAKGRR
jgi:hypothetical protein